MYPIIFDIETSALPVDQIAHLKPEFQAPKNYTDPEKIKASIATQEAQWLQDAALSPITGEVLAIGILSPSGVFDVLEGPEAAILEAFWKLARTEMGASRQMAGWCIHHFDLPFLAKRSFRNQIPIPAFLRTGPGNRWWHETFMDLQEIWKMGDQRAESSLDTVAKFLGVGAKTGDGAKFGELWRTDKQKAISYLRNDVELTAKIYSRIILAP